MDVRQRNLRILLTTSFPISGGNNSHILHNIAAACRHIVGPENVITARAKHAAKEIQRTRPSLVLFVGPALPEEVDFRLLTDIAKRCGTVSAIWLTDDPYEFDVRLRYVTLFDHVFTNDLGTVPYYFADDTVSHLPLAAGTLTDYRDITDWDGDTRLFFCGYPYANRVRVINDLVSCAPTTSLDLAGPKWEQTPGARVRSIQDHASLIDAYAGSFAVLNLGRTYNLANKYFSIAATTPGPRTFEAALAGAPQIYVSAPTELGSYFTSEEMFCVDDVRDVPDVLAGMESAPQTRKDLATRAQARALREHLYEHRIASALNTLAQRGLIET